MLLFFDEPWRLNMNPVGNPHKDAFDPATYVHVSRDEAAAKLDSMSTSAQNAVYDRAVRETDYPDPNLPSVRQAAVEIVRNDMQLKAEEAFLSGKKA